MSSPRPSSYQDHYQVLGVPPKTTSEAVQEAYQLLAARYHPNNRDTGNKEKFAAVNLAYEVLSDPQLRKQFDDSLGGGFQDDAPKFHSGQFFQAVGSEVQRRLCLLCLLYDRRRFKPATGSLSLRDLENLMAVTPDQLQLTIWYLKQRGLICSNDKSSLQITVEGMDYLERNLPSADSILALLRATAEKHPAPATSTP